MSDLPMLACDLEALLADPDATPSQKRARVHDLERACAAAGTTLDEVFKEYKDTASRMAYLERLHITDTVVPFLKRQVNAGKDLVDEALNAIKTADDKSLATDRWSRLALRVSKMGSEAEGFLQRIENAGNPKVVVNVDELNYGGLRKGDSVASAKEVPADIVAEGNDI